MYFLAGHSVVERVIWKERELSNIANCYKKKEDDLDKRNYFRLKLTEQILKIVKRAVENLIRQEVNKNKTDCFHTITWNFRSQFHFRSITWKRPSRKEEFSLFSISTFHLITFFTFHYGKSLWPNPKEYVWWALRNLGALDWFVKFEQSIHRSARSRVRANSSFSDDSSWFSIMPSVVICWKHCQY